MGEFGYKIKNYDAASIYAHNIGIKQYYQTKDAMLTNSLFTDFLVDNGLNIHKETSTRDIICIEFPKSHCVRTYEDELVHLKKLKAKYEKNHNKHYTEKQRTKYLEILARETENAHENKDLFKDKTLNGNDLRIIFYTEGVDIHYPVWKKVDGKPQIVDHETIHYKMLYRTPGKAKKGSCMFINEKLYDAAHDFLWMGLDLPYENAPIVEVGAYSSLITSTIVGKVQIKPEEILIMKDVDSSFSTKVISVETNEDKECYARKIDNYTVKNTMYDGQALIDSSIFPDWGDGYVLLRHHFCKMAAFKTHIQKFMHEYYGNDYETAEIVDMFGISHKVKDIKLITTENAIKWIKFGVSCEYWSNWVRKNDSMFGIVKTAHESKLGGGRQRMSYQMINALNLSTMDSVMKNSLDYITSLQKDQAAFNEYLMKNANYSNDYEVLVELTKHNPEFIKTDYYKSRKEAILRAYMLNLKSGKLIQNADNLVIVGSPYAMLLSSVGEDPFNDPTFEQEMGTIQCWTARFKDGEYLAEFRNPFNGRYNLGYLHNHYHEYFDKYFDFGELIIAINMNGTDAQDRNNGADQDSDSLYVTNQPQIVQHARWCYEKYPTIVNNIPKETNHYNNTLRSFAEIDNNLAAAQIAIGESSNLCQICLTYTYNFDDVKFDDYVCILSVLAQCAIDNAKRRYDIDLVKSIRDIKRDMNINQNGYPMFWLLIRREFNKEKINYSLACPMNSLSGIKTSSKSEKTNTISFGDLFIKHEVNGSRKGCKAIEDMIEKYSSSLFEFNCDDCDDEGHMILAERFEDLISDIQKTRIAKSNMTGMMSYLLNRCFKIGSGAKGNKGKMGSVLDKNKALLMKTLYSVDKTSFLECFEKQKGTPI